MHIAQAIPQAPGVVLEMLSTILCSEVERTVLKLPPQMNIGTSLHRTTMHVRAVQRLTKQSEECIDAWDIPSAILKVRDVQPSWILQTTLQVLSVKFDALIQPCPHNSAGILQASNWFCTHGDGALAPHPSLSSNGAPGMSMPHTAMPIRMS
ncbi:hypothetical protein NDA11_006867 [Ustilago hordei]|uniref:Uncharacterized protein n=1 Tax=Ustilago hordei TaxID=120017 RepID=I2FQ51_USTHO|nr:uncharacterized protein UHO2_06397 [Ustilago hordei]KAJ1038377.1 hypothetical protein NDA10_001799 [Ustilago hordei]KAJ1570420.1 hypothetical protein NDA15_005620 [Ustilago hordei]KAJ1571812.1 hypothetical protein NDA12_004153 [Ustilago hordei]KAJ1576029.1 hypothetical protein NDA11_006867 [Ustilago hordei]UTT87946.1 hypothetical protein NDA17_001713 [Ustilago hordei]